MQYSLFTHGTALQVESMEGLDTVIKTGWGTNIYLKPPPLSRVKDVDVRPELGPGGWFHIPLPSVLNSFGRYNPFLASVTLLFNTVFCRITKVDVYDGGELVESFPMDWNPSYPGSALHGDFNFLRDSSDVNPGNPQSPPQTYSNTLTLHKPHKVFSAIGISLYAAAVGHDYIIDDPNRRFTDVWPPAILTVSAAGAQFTVAEPYKLNVADRLVGVINSVGRLFK